MLLRVLTAILFPSRSLALLSFEPFATRIASGALYPGGSEEGTVALLLMLATILISNPLSLAIMLLGTALWASCTEPPIKAGIITAPPAMTSVSSLIPCSAKKPLSIAVKRGKEVAIGIMPAFKVTC